MTDRLARLERCSRPVEAGQGRAVELVSEQRGVMIEGGPGPQLNTHRQRRKQRSQQTTKGEHFALEFG